MQGEPTEVKHITQYEDGESVRGEETKQGRNQGQVKPSGQVFLEHSHVQGAGEVPEGVQRNPQPPAGSGM